MHYGQTVILGLLLLLQGCLHVPGTSSLSNTTYTGPVIDMHLHALGAEDQGPPPLALCAGMTAGTAHDPHQPWGQAFLAQMKAPNCAHPIWSAMTDTELRDLSLAELERFNVTAVLSGTPARVADWKEQAPGRIIPGLGLNIARDPFTPEDIAQAFKDGNLKVLAEVTNQYSGIAPDDPRFDAFWQVAADLDIPVGIHIGVGPPGAAQLFSGYKAGLHSPLPLENILKRHPTLRVYIMHAAWPMRGELKAMLYAHPHLYVDTGILQMALTREEYYDFLEDLVRSGYGDRIMFGSDQMVWPGLIEEGINAINQAPFLTLQQRQDILYGNAARFLRLSNETNHKPQK
ncbi:MAG: amidohydrolase [Alphaproteobacteria bacterium]|nr:MAG: amidohydrolase [Alphaproteobacteria bacterium]